MTTERKRVRNKASKKTPLGKNKPGVKNSLVNNINARKEKGKSKSKKQSTISKNAYENMKSDWKN